MWHDPAVAEPAPWTQARTAGAWWHPASSNRPHSSARRSCQGGTGPSDCPTAGGRRPESAPNSACGGSRVLTCGASATTLGDAFGVLAFGCAAQPWISKPTPGSKTGSSSKSSYRRSTDSRTVRSWTSRTSCNSCHRRRSVGPASRHPGMMGPAPARWGRNGPSAAPITVATSTFSMSRRLGFEAIQRVIASNCRSSIVVPLPSSHPCVRGAPVSSPTGTSHRRRSGRCSRGAPPAGSSRSRLSFGNRRPLRTHRAAGFPHRASGAAAEPRSVPGSALW